MNHEIIEVPSSAKGERIDQWLAQHTSYSRSAIKKMVEDQKVHVAGIPLTKVSSKIKGACQIQVDRDEPTALQPIKMPLDIVYEDDSLLVVNKPAGLLVYPVKDKSETTLVNGLLAYTNLSDYCGSDRPGVVHRIDRDTSGLILVAKNNIIHEKLYAMLEAHDIVREYIGIVKAPLDPVSGTIDKPIVHNYKLGTKREIAENGQPAITHYSCLYQNEDYAIVNFRLETGRTHQIRVHMASIGRPLIGDELYGIKKNVFGFQGQALHANHLAFKHPETGEFISVYGDAPALFQKAVQRIQST